MSLMQVINQKALISALTEFGERIGAQLGDACPRDTFNLALQECLKDLPQQKVKVKKTSSNKGPSKAALKKAAKLEELATLGGVAPAEDSIKAINSAISSRKKEIKAEEKAVKVAEKKAAAEDKKVKAAEKKALKKSTPSTKGKDYTQRRLKDADKNDIIGISGSNIRVSIHKESRQVLKTNEDNWTDEAHARYAVLFPTGFDVKVAKVKAPKVKKVKKVVKKVKKVVKKVKKPSSEDKIAAEQKALIAQLVGEAVEEVVENTEVEQVEEVEDSKLPAAEVEEESVVDSSSDDEVEDQLEEEVIEDEDDDEELEQLSADEDDEDDEEEEEPEFPGDEEIEEFQHDSLATYVDVDFYVDAESNVWDENRHFVGRFVSESDALVIKADYDPEEE